MSSQDSIGVVLKCMLKGAVDFLVKPVRKNELRNLWQHVWRRHCMNSQTNASETNAASNHISVNAANGSKTGENSGEGSDSQSSGSKREMEVQSVENAQQVVTVQWAGSLREIGDKQQNAHGGITMKAHVLDTSDDMPSGNKFDINSTPTYSPEKNVHPKCFSTATSGKVTGQDDALRIANASSRHPNDPGDVLLAFSEPIADRKCNSSLMEKNVGENALSEYSNGAAKERAESCPSHLLEINLGKQRLNGCMNRGFREKDIFTHSNFSAFSRYVNKGIQPSAQKPFLPSLCEGPHEFLNDEDSILQPYEVLLSHKHKTGESSMQVQVPLNSSKEGVAIFCSSSVREDTGTSNSSPRKDSCSHPQFGFIPVPIPIGSAIPYQNLCAGYGAISQPIYYPQASFMLCDSAAIKKLEENQKLHHPMQTQRESGELARIPLDQVNQSASCSQGIRKGSGCTGSGETADANANTIVVLESGNESGVQNCSSKGLDNDRSRREAALIKFRMKRKDRCFEKKVRYHSRKKLAEQRPRVKGQFVSQKLKSATTTHAETDFRIVVDL